MTEEERKLLSTLGGRQKIILRSIQRWTGSDPENLKRVEKMIDEREAREQAERNSEK